MNRSGNIKPGFHYDISSNTSIAVVKTPTTQAGVYSVPLKR